MPDSAERRWIEGWRAAGPELEEQRGRALRAMSPAQALFFSDAVLSLASPEDVPERRRAHSGLVDLQELLGRLRPK